MKIILWAVAAIMALFAVVQYNDPDGPIWLAIYSVPAIFAAIAAAKPDLLSGVGLALLGLASMAAFAGVVYYWPSEPDFWRQEIWWNSETAREGMGMMLVLLVLVIVLASRLAARRRTP